MLVTGRWQELTQIVLNDRPIKDCHFARERGAYAAVSVRRLVGHRLDRRLNFQRIGEDSLIVRLRRLDIGNDLRRRCERVDQFGFDREFHEALRREVGRFLLRSLSCLSRMGE